MRATGAHLLLALGAVLVVAGAYLLWCLGGALVAAGVLLVVYALLVVDVVPPPPLTEPTQLRR